MMRTLKKFFIKNRFLFYGIGLGFITSLFYIMNEKITHSSIASIFSALVVSTLSIHLVYRFLLSRAKQFRIYFIAVVTGLSFELFTVAFVTLFPGSPLPPLKSFLFSYAYIFIATVLMFILLLTWALLLRNNVFQKAIELIRSRRRNKEQSVNERFF